jgi:phage terminase large subunit-like protein
MERRARATSSTSPSEDASYAFRAARYLNGVLSGKTLSCKWVKLAIKRHWNDLERQRNSDWPYRFDQAEADRICRFAELMPWVEGKWDTPTVVLADWQVAVLGIIFGWRRKSDGGRRFSKVYFEIPRKAGKSTLAAIIGLFCLCCEGEPAPYVFIGATTAAQAQKVFHPMRMMVQKTPALADEFGLQAFTRSITERGGGYIQPIASKGSSQDGHNPACAILDELHAHKDRALYDVIDSAFGARKNPLLWIITTAGFDSEGVCYEQRTFVAQVLEGVVEAEHYFGIIFTIDDGDDPYTPATWAKANPNLGVSVQLASMESAATEAKNQPGKAAEFLTKRLNVWTSAKFGHIDAARWRACSGIVDLEAMRRVPCWGGIDLGAVSDLTSFRLIWWHEGRLKTWGTRYLPEAAANARASKSNSPFKKWLGVTWYGRPLLTVTPGDVTDYSWIEKDIRWALATFNVQMIGFDKWNSTDLVNRLLEDNAPMAEVRQGVVSLTAAMKELDRQYLGGTLDHSGDPALAWCASNVVARRDENDNIAPSKKLSPEKIDDYAALLNAVAVSLTSPLMKPSVYETQRGLTFL